MHIIRAPIIARNLAPVPAQKHPDESHPLPRRDRRDTGGIQVTLILGDEKCRHLAPDVDTELNLPSALRIKTGALAMCRCHNDITGKVCSQ